MNLGTARGAIISAALFGRFFDANRVLKLKKNLTKSKTKCRRSLIPARSKNIISETIKNILKGNSLWKVCLNNVHEGLTLETKDLIEDRVTSLYNREVVSA